MGRRARAEEGQVGLHEDGQGADVGALDDEGRHQRGQDVEEQHARGAGADRARPLDHGVLAQAQHLGAHDPHDARDLRHHQRDDHRLHAGAHEGHQGQGEQDGRDRHEPVDDAHDDRVERPIVAADQPDGRARGESEQGHDEADAQRDATPVERAGEDVAAEMVRAERVLGVGGAQADARIHLLGIGRGPEGGGDGAEREKQQHDAPGGERGIARHEHARGMGAPARDGHVQHEAGARGRHQYRIRGSSTT